MTDGLKSHIRTLWPILLGQLTTILVAYVASKYGVHVDNAIAYGFVSGAVTSVVYAAGRWLETRRWKPARVVGRAILSLGLVAERPTYVPPAPAGTVRPLPRHELL